MSCFIVSDKHISALARFAVTERILDYHNATGIDWTEQEIGELLNAENTKSYNARYREAVEPAFRYVVTPALSPVELIKAIDCYEYQACEHDGWETSQAHALCQEMRARATNALPGYADAPWGLE